MNKSLLHKTKQFFWLIIKIILLISCGYFICSKITNNPELSFDHFLEKLNENKVLSLKNTCILIIFSIFNWFLEILKWQKLCSKTAKITFFEAAKQCLASLTASLITPNRIGEYGAKALFFKKENRKQIVLLNGFGNLTQLLATLVFGLAGFTYLFNKNPRLNQYYSTMYTAIIILVSTGVIVLVLSKKIKKRTSLIDKKKLIIVSFLSFLRFVIFSHQFYFLLLLFNIHIPYFEAISSIAVMYLIASLIPMLSLFDVLLKSSIAIIIFGYFKVDELDVISITTLMWTFNFVFPSIIGSYFVLTFNIKK